MGYGSSHDRYRGRFQVKVEADAAGAVDKSVWIANRPCKLMGIKEVHSTVGGASAAVRPRKITDTSAPGAAASATVIELTSAAIDLTATVNVQQTPTLVSTGTVRNFKVGDRLAHDYSGTMTGLVGMVIVYDFQAI